MRYVTPLGLRFPGERKRLRALALAANKPADEPGNKENAIPQHKKQTKAATQADPPSLKLRRTGQ